LQGEVAVARVRICRSAWEQLRGLIGYPPLPPGAALALPGCAAVHTAFVSAPIDVLFLRGERVIAVATRLPPWRAARARGASMVLEAAAGSTVSWGIQIGDVLTVRPDVAPRQG
jgi:uncharacterized membrane protein (UPF0127 family)